MQTPGAAAPREDGWVGAVEIADQDGSCEFTARGGSPCRRLTLISANRPAIHYSRFANSTARGQHFRHVQVTAKPRKILGTLQIRLPSAKPRIVLIVEITFQFPGEIRVTPQIDARVRHHRFALRHPWWPRQTRRRRNKPTRIRPSFWKQRRCWWGGCWRMVRHH